jgi:hypothetical protein
MVVIPRNVRSKHKHIRVMDVYVVNLDTIMPKKSFAPVPSQIMVVFVMEGNVFESPFQIYFGFITAKPTWIPPT